MATVTYIPEKTQSKTAMGKVMRYCVRKDKTAFELDGRKFQLISGKDCVAETAFKEFMATKKQFGKENGMFFYQYVQSFSPDEKITPKTAHEIGCKFAEYFKGHEVLIATHTDREHLHTHFIINSVSHETGKKLQMARGSIHKLRQFSDEICKQYGLSIVQPKEQKSGVKTREYRAALKGESWKFKLINAVDNAMENSRSKAEFTKQMRKMGYQVKWQDNLKHITYTTPEGNKCRDNKLHDEKYLKERMEVFYELRQAQGFEQAGEFDRPIQYQVESVRNPAGNAGTAFDAPVRDRAGANSHAAANQQAAELGGVDRESDSSNRQDIGIQQRQNRQLREKPAVGFSESDECAELGGQENNNGADSGIGENAQSAGYVRLEAPAQMDGSGRDAAAVVLGAALALGSLVSQPEEDQQKKYVPKAGKRHKRKRQQTISHTPFNIIDVPMWEQSNRLKTLLVENDMLIDNQIIPNEKINADEQNKIIGSFNYIQYNSDQSSYMPEFLDESILNQTEKAIFGFEQGDYYGKKPYSWIEFQYDYDYIDMTNYTKLYQDASVYVRNEKVIVIYNDESEEVKGFYDVLKALYLEYENSGDQLVTTEKMEYEFGDKKLIITAANMSSEDGQGSSINFSFSSSSCYLLQK